MRITLVLLILLVSCRGFAADFTLSDMKKCEIAVKDFVKHPELIRDDFERDRLIQLAERHENYDFKMTKTLRLNAIKAVGAARLVKGYSVLTQAAKEKDRVIAKAAKQSIEMMKPITDDEILYSENCRRWFKLDGKWIRLPDIDFTYQSTLHTSDKEADLSIRMASKRNPQWTGMLRNRTQLVSSIPDLKLGSYGRLQVGEYKIVQNIDGENNDALWKVGRTPDKLVKSPLYVRIVGNSFPALYPVPKDGVAPLEIVVVGTYKYENPLGETREAALAVGLRKVRDGLTWWEFEDLRRSGVDLTQGE